MKTRRMARPAWLVGSLLLAMAGAQAAGGYRVMPEQEALVKPGLSMEEVQQALGKPAQTAKFGNEPGPTWTYAVANTELMPKWFDVDFSRDGRVLSASERLVPEHPFGSH